MAVRIVLGRAGTGKSRFVRHDIVSSRPDPAFLLVPEQQTYESERALIGALGARGLMGVEVLSFSRLAKYVLNETGIAWGHAIDHAGLCMALRRVLEESAPELSAYKEACKKPGFLSVCLEHLQRCKQYDITSEALLSAAQTQPPLLGAKLRDFALIKSRLDAFLLSRYMDAEDEINMCVRQIPACPSLKDARVYVDGFERMNGQRYRMVAALMRVSAQFTMTFRVAPDPHASDAWLFETENAAMARVISIADEQGQETDTLCLPKDGAPWGGQRERDKALIHLERTLFASPQKKYAMEPESIRLTACANADEEARTAATEISRLARTGVRYSDMAVVVGDAERYKLPLRRAMGMLNIPCFLDASRPLSGHGLTEMITASLSLVARMDTAALLRVAKSGFALVTEDETELLENMALRRGLRGNQWLHALDAPDEALEEARKKLIEPILALKAELNAARSAKQCAEAVLAYLETLGARARLEARQEALYAAGRHSLAQENAQVWHIILSVLMQLGAIWGDAPGGAKRFAALLEAGFAAHEAGAVPPLADQLPISDMARTRLGGVKALFLLGANEFPPARDEIINRRELASLRAHGLSVWPDGSWEDAQARLLLYAVLSRPTERLYISYARMDTEGRALTSDLFVERLKGCFPGIKPIESEPGPYTPAQAFETLCDGIRENRRALGGLYAWLWNNGAKEQLNMLINALDNAPEAQRISPATAKGLYGKRMLTTASRVERYYRCPFAHLAAYGIRAKVRERRQAARPDAGLLVHKALEEIPRLVAAAGMDWSILTEADLDAMLDSVWERLLDTFAGGLWRSSGRLLAQAAALKRGVRQAMLAMRAQYAQGDFVLAGAETAFGPGEVFGAYPLSERAELCGKIDRIDIWRGEGETYARVVDYKLGDPRLKYADIFAGSRLQPLLYMLVATDFAKERHGDAEPAGLFLMGVNDPWREEGDAAPVIRLRGLTLDDAGVMRAMDHSEGRQSEIVHVGRYADSGAPYGEQVLTLAQMERAMAFAKSMAAEAAEGMYAGDARAFPLQSGEMLACNGCDYACACGFDPNAPGANARSVQALRRDRFFEVTGG